ncbi:MAG: redox-sensing transcriptional repressor Rex [Spirochaetaceae bacterium 4572_59]|nr:MAG: redox-sensing transcriptional repressor Rex [Spirochaetaceae bacterium 4572_59]
MSKISEKFKQSIASIPTIKRLPSYLNLVKRVDEDGKTIISATTIAKELDLEPIQVRKDLAVTGITGKPRIGYQVTELIKSIESFLNWDTAHKTVIVGAGNLGSALMNYRELRNHGLCIAAIVDANPSKIGTEKKGHIIQDVQNIPQIVKDTGASMAIVTVPPEQAQVVTDLLNQTDIRSIWNFTNVKLKVMDHILVLDEDLSSGFAVLSMHMPFYRESIK